MKTGQKYMNDPRISGDTGLMSGPEEARTIPAIRLKQYMAKRHVIALLGMFCAIPLFAQNLDITVEELDGALRIVKSGGSAKELVIPQTINDLPVTSIGPGAFANRGLEKITIPDTVTEIGDLAFADNRLTGLVLGDNVTVVGRGAFSGNRLTQVTLGRGLSSIGRGAFLGNRITDLTITDNITAIEDFAFFSNNIQTLSIPGTVTVIGAGAFSGNRISRLELNQGVADIGAGAFYDNQIKSVTIPDSVTSMGKRAFDLRGTGVSGVVEYRDTGGNLLLSTSKNFDAYYTISGKRAGTYTLTQEGWRYGEQ
jgi:hypothetical protein